MNMSLKTGVFPDIWKCAMIKPLIQKISAGTAESNYRPVPNLKYLSKLLECLVLKQIVDHCENNKLLPNAQSAYPKGFSCETMLVKLTGVILNGMKNKLISAVVALHLSAAFDTVNHRILLETFKNYYGLDGTVLSWVKSYLSNRSCFVNVDGKHSNPSLWPGQFHRARALELFISYCMLLHFLKKWKIV